MDYHFASFSDPAPRKRRRVSAPGPSITVIEARSSSELSPPSASAENGLAKGRKVSRACDFCKSRKAKCSGTQPCDKCLAKGRSCLYDAKYTRGRPPTPPLRPLTDAAGASDMDLVPRQESTAPSRASPELGLAEIQGQVFDSTSGISFLHRAWKRLSATKNANAVSEEPKTLAENQHVTLAGDNPLPPVSGRPLSLPEPAETRRLLSLYFDVCIATYRFLHRPTIEGWLTALERNLETSQPIWHGIGRAKAAIVLVVLAIACAHHENSSNPNAAETRPGALNFSDELFGMATNLTGSETGLPRLESAQARLVQVLYLLTTSRFNHSWYVFGTTLQFISALGLHRRNNPKRRRVNRAPDYIHAQCGLRTFWTAYILDNYLGIIFGRPRHFHDEDIDQDLPERVNDEYMTADGPKDAPGHLNDCHIDSLIFHIRIALIIGSTSRDVYSTRINSEQERIAAAHRLMRQLNEWRESLPLHLGSIPPAMLIASYRRQATVLKLAHSHAIMHVNRLFLLGSSPTSLYEGHVNDCITAAKTVLEMVDISAREGPIFHSFWWTHYVTFIALVVVYVWEMQQRRQGRTNGTGTTAELNGKEHRTRLLRLAEACHRHLAQATAKNSPSRRYAVILEEFREAALSQPPKSTMVTEQAHNLTVEQPSSLLPEASASLSVGLAQSYPETEQFMAEGSSLLDEWDTTDWLDLDSSAFWPNVDFSDSPTWPSLV